MTERARLVDEDRLFWEITRRYEMRPMVCGVLLPLAGPPDRAQLRARLREAIEAHPRLGQCVVEDRDGPRWEPCDVDRATSVTWEHDASLRDHDDALQRAAVQMNARLSPNGPPWQCRVLADCPEADPSGRVFCLWLRWHHSLTDGEGMLDLLAALCGSDLRARSPALAGDRKPTLAGGRGTGWTRSGALGRFLKERAGARTRRKHAHPGSHATEVRRLELPLHHELLLALARRHGVSTNDVLLSATAWVIEQHRASLGQQGPTTILSPVSRRALDDGVVLGNHSHALRLSLDDLPRDPAARIAMVGARTATAMAGAGTIPYWVYGALFRLPQRVLDRALAGAPPYLCNYLPWADRPQTLAGQAITALHGFTPLLPYHGCTFAYSSHAGAVTCTVTTDPAIVTDADVLPSLLDRAFHELARIAPGDPESASLLRS